MSRVWLGLEWGDVCGWSACHDRSRWWAAPGDHPKCDSVAVKLGGKWVEWICIIRHWIGLSVYSPVLQEHFVWGGKESTYRNMGRVIISYDWDYDYDLRLRQ